MDSDNRKVRQKEILRAFKLKEKQAFLDRLPFSEESFKGLFNFLDEHLEDIGCDHSLTLTVQYLKSNGLYSEKAIAFLEENGGFCDCEVLGNVEWH